MSVVKKRVVFPLRHFADGGKLKFFRVRTDKEGVEAVRTWEKGSFLCRRLYGRPLSLNMDCMEQL